MSISIQKKKKTWIQLNGKKNIFHEEDTIIVVIVETMLVVVVVVVVVIIIKTNLSKLSF